MTTVYTYSRLAGSKENYIGLWNSFKQQHIYNFPQFMYTPT